MTDRSRTIEAVVAIAAAVGVQLAASAPGITATGPAHAFAVTIWCGALAGGLWGVLRMLRRES